MGKRTQSMIGTENGVATVRVFSANPKTADGYNTFIFRRSVEKSLRKLSWLPVIDGRDNPLPSGVAMGDKTVEYTEAEKCSIRKFVVDVANGQKGPLLNDDFGKIGIGRDFVKEIQQHCISTRRDVAAVSSAREIATRMVHFTASPNQEAERRNGILYFEYGLARLRFDDGLYLAMGEVGVRRNSQPYYDQCIVAKFKADSEAPSLHGHLRIGESAFDIVYDSRFRLILQGVEQYFLQTEKSKRKIPFFSIIIPVYNVAPYLRECLDSVLTQTFGDWEAICVDDGSTDGSGAILDEYAAKDNRFKVIHQKNAGVSAARNRALEAMTGDWFLFLDGDDLLYSDALAIFVPYIKYNDVDGILVHPYCSSWNGKDVSRRDRVLSVIIKDASKEDLFIGPYAANGFVFSRIYSTRKFRLLRFREDMAMAEDVCFWFDALSVAARWIILRAEYYLYRQRGDSVCGEGNPHRCGQILESVLHALNVIDKRLDVSKSAGAKYLRRFSWSPRHYIGLAACRYRELTNEEWDDLSYKVKAIDAECGRWSLGVFVNLIMAFAVNRRLRFMLPILLRTSNCYDCLRIQAGGLSRKLGFMRK